MRKAVRNSCKIFHRQAPQLPLRLVLLALSPRDIEAVINRARSSSASEERAPDKERIFNLRVPELLVNQVDALRKKSTGKISRNTWILEAIEDKIEREQEIGE